MELKIYNSNESFPQQIEWNYEELKVEIEEKAKEYATSIYADDSIKAAKADRANLNKFITAITGKRTEIRKQLLAPDEKFGQEVKELTGIIQSAIENIDSQIKGYEERQREEKTAKVRDFYEENIADMADILPFEKTMKPQYANASTTMKSIKEEILALIQRVSEGIAILNEVDSPYAGDMKAVFLQTYDIGAAMAERNRLEEAEERRKAFEVQRLAEKERLDARKKAETERIAQFGKASSEQETTESITAPDKQLQLEEPIYVIDFRVHATQKQLNLLKSFLMTSDIRFEPVPKGE